MAFLTELWLPILLSGVFVFIASSVIHMALPHHRSDVKKMPGEDQVLDAFRAAGVKPGAYMFPMPDNPKDCHTPEMQAKMKAGPSGWITLFPEGGFKFGQSLVQWFVHILVVSLFVAYLAWEALGPGADYLRVFQITGAAAFLTYGLGNIHDTIWKGQSWTVTAKFVVDGLAYALLTGGVFGWLWPAIDAAANGAPAGLPG